MLRLAGEISVTACWHGKLHRTYLTLLAFKLLCAGETVVSESDLLSDKIREVKNKTSRFA